MRRLFDKARLLAEQTVDRIPRTGIPSPLEQHDGEAVSRDEASACRPAASLFPLGLHLSTPTPQTHAAKRSG